MSEIKEVTDSDYALPTESLRRGLRVQKVAKTALTLLGMGAAGMGGSELYQLTQESGFVEHGLPAAASFLVSCLSIEMAGHVQTGIVQDETEFKLTTVES